MNSVRRVKKKASKQPTPVPNRNTELNICNQALGFIVLSKKSETFLQRVLRASGHENIDELCRIYYSYSKLLKKHQRMYLNRKFLLRISTEVEGFAMKEVQENPCYQSEKLPME